MYKIENEVQIYSDLFVKLTENAVKYFTISIIFFPLETMANDSQGAQI